MSGVKAAHEVAKKNGGEVRGDCSTINFDVAVTTTDTGEKKGGAGIFVAGVFGIGGQGSATNTNSQVSRIQFAVSVHLPQSFEENYGA